MGKEITFKKKKRTGSSGTPKAARTVVSSTTHTQLINKRHSSFLEEFHTTIFTLPMMYIAKIKNTLYEG